MDSRTIEKLLLKDPCTRLFFRGVYSSDTLPLDAKEGLYIVNEAKSHEPGTHWIGLHITPKRTKNVYFDSYGRKPTLKEVENFLGHKYVHNKKTLQHMLSTSCGQLEAQPNHKPLQFKEATSQ